jgi:hypothetical protein
MSLIKPRARGKSFVQYRTGLERENHETLHAYAVFLGEDAEYVVNQLIDDVLAKDRDFVKWRAEHRGPFAPRATAARSPDARRRSPSHKTRTATIVAATSAAGSTRA